MLLVAALAITMIGCLQIEEGTFIQGKITEINKENGDIEIESWKTVSDAVSSTESYEFENKPDSQTIRVANPKKYGEGQKI
ncbi:hypothetical protein [Bacillus sp. N1-1]|uniref:hypothetical protein n=1 Tax=Bacillus sp. N1-1 TaxID=2682541 RepID=UPI00131906EC|nr:hypothetical protein [Bacillus sp. N1-1]QHA92222.1 hypothetical protein GNK04_12735 [Bacillus sp. N1-1]